MALLKAVQFLIKEDRTACKHDSVAISHIISERLVENSGTHRVAFNGPDLIGFILPLQGMTSLYPLVAVFQSGKTTTRPVPPTMPKASSFFQTAECLAEIKEGPANRFLQLLGPTTVIVDRPGRYPRYPFGKILFNLRRFISRVKTTLSKTLDTVGTAILA
ncbi:hypothetical protein J6590_026409 [Homalodisca vitripennis]|nr:hypothetical protein J6590_026409 [Homalodisca vitripennis]